eukprot:CAMPEP_0119560468 /NCGR_PEP_ID=MMETSP1352-20130426/14918_1 /TAXON_ID=265584 /ORGANISM="Stauroneis constricta, Strain CCMP1120" /LENGTH=333 /DNA_ID=CAMNT_0007608449 /DNA_START=99 /DNA_END=1100 /DNA_ORIENTATION=+
MTTNQFLNDINNNNNNNNNNNASTTIANDEAQLRESDPDLQHEARKNSIVDVNATADNASDANKKKYARMCPFAHATSQGNKAHQHQHQHQHQQEHPYHFVPLRMGGSGRTHRPSKQSQALIRQEVSLDDLKTMTDKFYELAFQDATLDKFIRSHSDPHGDRFAKWIHQKLSGSTVWDEDRMYHRDTETPHTVAGGRQIIVHDRSSAHVAAWYSPKRDAKDVGRHFTLEECRVWMRLHFWAMRLSGVMDKSPSFADYYVRFIAHFVSVYERTAPQFARDSFRWSADPANIDRYIADGREMRSVLGVSFAEAVGQVPADEIDDEEWPYNQSEAY